MKNTRVLVCPLNWGLGHASRCIPIIQALKKQQAEVFLGGDGQALELLKKEFPAEESIRIKDYRITYPENGGMVRHFLPQMSAMKRHLQNESNALKEVVAEYGIQGVISDNRYGLHTQDTSNVILTHQLAVPVPIFSKFVNRRIHALLRRFDQIWVPDHEGGEGLAGRLSANSREGNKIVYTGPISRFKKSTSTTNIDLLAILSGPEPSRTSFENELLRKMGAVPGRHVLVRGSTNAIESSIPAHVEVISFVDAKDLNALIDSAKYLVSRSGYSSIMDYVEKERNALLIPTPGQYEQEYLAQYHEKKGSFVIQKQGEIDLAKAMEDLKRTKKIQSARSNGKLDEIINDFLDSLY